MNHEVNLLTVEPLLPDEFSSLQRFADHVERQPAFEWALQQDFGFSSALYAIDPAMGE